MRRSTRPWTACGRDRTHRVGLESHLAESMNVSSRLIIAAHAPAWIDLYQRQGHGVATSEPTRLGLSDGSYELIRVGLLFAGTKGAAWHATQLKQMRG